MRRSEKYHSIIEKVAAEFPMPIRCFLSGGVLENGNGGNSGFLAFDKAQMLDIDLPREAVILMPQDLNISYNAKKPLTENATILICTQNDAMLYAEIVANILGCESINSISLSVAYIANLGLFPFQLIPKFLSSDYSIAAISLNLSYNKLKGISMDCIPNCCQNTINLGCLEQCETVTIPNLQTSTNYGVFVKVPHSSTSSGKFEVLSDPLGNLQLPINPSFSGEYYVRLHQNNAIQYDCVYFTINP